MKICTGYGKFEVAGIINAGFDLLEQGKFDQAQKVYESLLQKDPGPPLALNNLAAIMVKLGKYDQAIGYLKQALPRAKGIKVAFNRVCTIESVCAAPSITQDQLGSEDLERVVKSNLLMVEMARSSRPGGK
ncbi:MAG: tetratricopeptide repeat protein [Deltaproteobacteria bacterium]|nr:tetratricopeptide repeat protein [Deltaproteobacteria bacterium]